MILSDHTIRERLHELVQSPESVDEEEQIQPASLDIRLGETLYNQREEERTETSDWHTLEPGVPYLGHTMEYVTMPRDLAAMMTGRSSLGRRNIIVHQTAGWVDPGFEGELTFEFMNIGTTRQRIDVGERVAQLVYFTMDRPSSGYSGQYQGQVGVRE